MLTLHGGRKLSSGDEADIAASGPDDLSTDLDLEIALTSDAIISETPATELRSTETADVAIALILFVFSVSADEFFCYPRNWLFLTGMCIKCALSSCYKLLLSD